MKPKSLHTAVQYLDIVSEKENKNGENTIPGDLCRLNTETKVGLSTYRRRKQTEPGAHWSWN